MRNAWLNFVKRRKYRGYGQQRPLAESIKRVFDRQFVLLENVGSIVSRITSPYVIVGGHAVAYHGHPRTTQDIDIITSPGNGQSIISQLDAEVEGPLGCNIPTLTGYATRVNGVDVDVMELDEPWVDDMLSAAVSTPHGRMVSAEYLVLLKILGKRGLQDDTDIMRVLKHLKKPSISFIRKMLKRYMPTEVEDFDSMVEIVAVVDI